MEIRRFERESYYAYHIFTGGVTRAYGKPDDEKAHYAHAWVGPNLIHVSEHTLCGRKTGYAANEIESELCIVCRNKHPAWGYL